MEMDKEFQNVTLKDLGGGAAEELFQNEIQRVIENILDPNTDAEAMRKITLELKIRPSKNREIGNCEISIHSKFADNSAYSTTFYIGRDNGKPVVYENTLKQLTFEDEKIIPIKSEEGK